MRERFVSVRGLDLCICEWGDPADPAVLCLHGWLDQGAMWTPVAERLAAKGLFVLAPDARGHGRSSHVGRGGYYHFPDYAVDVDGIIRAYGLSDVCLVGHSMGGTVAAMYAAGRPERISGLVLLEGLGPPTPSDDYALLQWRTHLDHMLEDHRIKIYPDIDAAAARLRRSNRALGPELALILAGRATEPCEGGVRWRWDPLHRTRAPTAFVRDRFMTLLRAIEPPTWLLYGASSFYLQLPDLSEREEALPNLRERLVLPGGHHFHLGVPAEVVEIIRGCSR